MLCAAAVTWLHQSFPRVTSARLSPAVPMCTLVGPALRSRRTSATVAVLPDTEASKTFRVVRRAVQDGFNAAR